MRRNHGHCLQQEALEPKAIGNQSELDALMNYINEAALPRLEHSQCAKLVGRKLEGIDDHVGYLADGGCAKIIEVFAATSGRLLTSK